MILETVKSTETIWRLTFIYDNVWIAFELLFN